MITRTMPRHFSILNRWVFPFGACIVLFALDLSLLSGSHRILLWGPREVPQQMLFLPSLFTSLGRVAVGGLLSFVLALAVTLTVFIVLRHRITIPMLGCLLIAITPPPIWSTLVILGLGIGPLAPVATIILSTLFMVSAVNFYLLSQIPRRRFHIGEVYRFSVRSTVRYIILPEMKSGLFLGLRLNLLVAWIALVTAESFGTSSGLGALLLSARQLFDWKALLASWAAIVGSALFTDACAVFIASKVIGDPVEHQVQEDAYAAN